MNVLENKNSIIFKPEGEYITVEVKLDKETVWLTQEQMSLLFDRERSVITKHINNIFKEGELDRKSNVQNLHIPNSDKPVMFFSLDVIISVGYRVKSQKGTQFRIWANKILKDYLLKGYAVNERRLQAIKGGVEDLYRTLEQIKKVNSNLELSDKEKQSFVDLILEYSESLNLLKMFDEGELVIPKELHKNRFDLSYENAISEIDHLRETLKAGELFGREKDKGFKSAIANIYQTFGGDDLYPSAEVKAANLLYLVIKNHGFSDGNKRIGSYFFVRFLDANGLLRRRDGSKVISENTLVALAIMVAQSDPKHKEQIVELVVNLIAK